MLKIQEINGTVIGVAPIEGTSEGLLSQLDKKEYYFPTLQRMGENRKREWLATRVLLKKLLGEEKEILYTDSKKPYLADSSYFISISHTKGYVAVILNEKLPVAIDIEYVSSRVEEIKKRFLNANEEKNISKNNSLIHLLLHWSAKESLFKLLEENDIEFKAQLHIKPFEPKIGSTGSFIAYETRTSKRQSFCVNYITTKEYVLTFIT
jgi:phosphopantetheinyl transferase